MINQLSAEPVLERLFRSVPAIPEITEFHCIKPGYITQRYSSHIDADPEKESEVNIDFDVGASANAYKAAEMVAARLIGKRKDTFRVEQLTI